MVKLLKYFYHHTFLGKHLFNWLFELHHKYRINCINEKIFIAQNFKKSFGYDLDWNNPKTLNEKINWLKLNHRTPLQTQCADKYAVRNYVKEKVGNAILIPLVFKTEIVSEVVSENLPDKPFILKTNHGSSGGIVVKSKAETNWCAIRKELQKQLNTNYYKVSKEWQYKNITPCIIAEELLIDSSGELPFDYKFHCFHGKVKAIQVDIDRFSNHKRNFYDENWILLPFTWSVWKENKPIWLNGRDISKPENLDKMIAMAEKLSDAFPYARIDLYNCNGKIYFGEITFHHGGGTERIEPKEWDKKFGGYLNLSIL